MKKVDLKEEGVSTLAPRKIWFDDTVRRLNADGRGTLLGSFKGDDKILTINQNGEAKLLTFDLLNRFDDEYLILEKWKPEQPITCIYFDGEKRNLFHQTFLAGKYHECSAFYAKRTSEIFRRICGNF